MRTCDAFLRQGKLLRQGPRQEDRRKRKVSKWATWGVLIVESTIANGGDKRGKLMIAVETVIPKREGFF